MRIIPKTSKVKLTFYKGLTIPDFIVGFITLVILAITVSTNFPFKWYIALGELILVIPFYISISGERLYEYIGFFFKYMATRKKYSLNNKNENADIRGIIPYKDIDEDLIINRDGTFVSVIEVHPIDFRLLSIDKQDDFIDGVMRRVINNIGLGEEYSVVKLERPLILDGNIKDELERLEAIVDAYERGDLTDSEKEARIDLIQDRITLIDRINSGETVFYSRYYLSMIGKNKEEVRYKISRAKSLFSSNGIEANILKEKELVAFIRYSLDSDFDERTLDDVTNYSSYLLPEKVNFNLTFAKQGKYQLSHFVINNYPLKVGNGWGEGLFDMENTKVVMKLVPVEKFKAVRRIDNAILEIQTAQAKDKASELIDRDTHLDTLQDLLVGIQTDNETLFDTTIIVTIYDEIGKNINKKKVRTRLREMGFGFTEMLGRQNEAFITSTITSIDKVKITRGIQTSTLSACFPFVSNAIMDKRGLLIGENRLPVFIDFFKRDSEHVNSNMVVIGKPGSGKSYATKTIMAGLASSNTRIFVLDPENEYKNLAKNLGGTSIDVSNSNYGMINPFQIIDGIDEEENSFYSHLQFLEEFYRLILPGINSDSLEMLNKITQELYESKNINSKVNLKLLSNRDYPTFDDLNNLIESKLSVESDDYIKTCLKVIINYVAKFKTGGRNSSLWNGYTTFSPKENFIAFNFQRLLANKNDVTANAQMLLVLKWLENEVIKNRDYNIRHNSTRRLVVAIDEAHLFIDEKYPIALDFMYQLAKRIRKYDGMLIIITQNIKDFAGTPDIARKSSAIINVSQYSLIFSLSPHDMTELCMLYENAGRINETEKDNIVHNPRGRCFLISSPNKRTNIDIIATNFTERMFS